MSTSLLEDVHVQTTDTGDHDRMAHYFRRTDLDKAFLEGQSIQAVCGKWDVPTRDFKKYPVCGTCKDVYEQMKKE